MLSSGNNFRRGDVFTIASVQKHPEQLDIYVQLSDYAHYLGTINNIIPKEYACRVIYTAALVETSDSKKIFGEMAPNTSRPGRLQCAGGGLDLSDLNGNRFDLWHNIKSELYEELGLDLDDKNIIANFLASSIMDTASSTVSPWLMQPGRSGISMTYPPS